MPFQIIRNDITKVKADAIVNTANPKPKFSSGTDSAIYVAAGADQLLAERKKIGDIKPGHVAVTSAYNLDAQYIIHAVGPTWIDGKHGEYDTLKSCYANALDMAFKLDCESIAFPLMATGSNQFPKERALQIALNEIGTFLMRPEVDMDVYLVVFDENSFVLSRNVFFQVESYITDQAIIDAHKLEYGISEQEYEIMHKRFENESKEYLNHYMNSAAYQLSKAPESPKKPFTDETFDMNQFMNDGKADTAFVDLLLKMIAERDLDNATVYHRSNVKKKAFSKILCGDTKIPKKDTVMCFCIGLQLDLEEAARLMASASTAFNPADNRDKLIMQCLERGQYDLNEINSMLFKCKQPQLGSAMEE